MQRVQFGLTDSFLSFGEEIAMVVKLPTKDDQKVRRFICNEEIIRCLWPVDKLKLQSKGCYKLYFESIILPPFGATITPAVDVILIVENGKLFMQSGQFYFEGINKNVLSGDSGFLENFKFNLTGILSAISSDVSASSGVSSAVSANVCYTVSGKKPTLLKFAPPILMEQIINGIKTTMRRFTSQEISVKLLKGFREFDRKSRST